MPSRRTALLGLAAATLACFAPGRAARLLAQENAATVVSPVPAVPPEGDDADESDEPRYATPTTRDRAGRVVAPVRIGPHGPLRFIVDTGANRSAIAASTAARIGAVATSQALVHGITGAAVMPQVEVPEFKVGELLFKRQRLAILPDAVFGGTDGIIGIDTLQKARIDIDFVRDRVTVGKSTRRAPGDRLVVKATLKHRGLLLVSGRVGGVRVKAIIDTGAERSLGNEKLFVALSGRGWEPYMGGTSTVVGATAQVARGKLMLAPVIDLGGDAKIADLPVTFGDFHVFKVWELLGEPALVIGMDVLGTVPAFSIDYPRREFQVKVEHRLPPVQLNLQ